MDQTPTHETPSNVVDLNSRRKSILPSSVRTLATAQYIESKEQNHSAEQFYQFLERRLMAEVAMKGYDFAKELFGELFGPNDERH